MQASGGQGKRLRRWLDRVLPPVCVACGDPLKRGGSEVCDVCWARAPLQRSPLCPRCGISLHDKGVATSTSTCIECRDWLPYLRQARAPYVMRGTASVTVHALKYGGWRQLAEMMGTRMAELRFDPHVEADLSCVVAVPLSQTRLRERGFNQAELLARSVARNRNLPLLSDVLVRQRHTSRQARLPLSERSANVSGAFRLREGKRGRVEDAHVLLVDDVLTTAATVQDCVRALCVGGARAASVLTFARARPELMRQDD